MLNLKYTKNNMKNVRVSICNHTNKLVVQEKFGKEWVCMHGANEKEDLKLIKKVKYGRI